MTQAEILDGRIGTIANYTAPTYPNGQGSPAHLEFGMRTSLGENGVFYIDLTQIDGALLAGLVLTAHARQLPVEIVFTTPAPLGPIKPKDPGGFVRGVRVG